MLWAAFPYRFSAANVSVLNPHTKAKIIEFDTIKRAICCKTARTMTLLLFSEFSEPQRNQCRPIHDPMILLSWFFLFNYKIKLNSGTNDSFNPLVLLIGSHACFTHTPFAVRIFFRSHVNGSEQFTLHAVCGLAVRSRRVRLQQAAIVSTESILLRCTCLKVDSACSW